ncbi:3-hydroxyisobutyryl-CoA hydrolase, mitochondrial [Pseudorhizobium banfieldiae]|uniref:3-hydroxyisobutyryl-CoA hydrolase n=1 Tax=Pseudorhizobium banfieldiae TaxID=1125847 RepID=L0NHM1_9HYPH|nr:enoyl-CoA hydratase/isomerase family protein [Pseudorhizobium banfieldiae]CAD6616824.1 enoyl-CoA hydratase/isomerase family protein [arsenite-oxidising bacterium NT-25]CCF20608.1 3-hydroxyisobutyryl-CoA hydrolase, mitochondrial [Pseudorhizobium banfieldiae]
MSDEVILDRVGSAAVIRLNRPKALNSLNLPMVRAIREAMEQYLDDASIKAVILTGEGERGLCAGGDIRVLYDMGKARDPEATRFWREEFPLNYAISHYPKPYVVLMDGITMGGGVGLSAHGRHRIVTERTRLAMPETGIGYFPDVGATWLLPQAPGEVGTWMGLTGIEVDAAGAIYAGLADVLVPSDQLDALVEAIGALAGEAEDGNVEATIARFTLPPGESALEKNRSVIDRCFGFDRVEDILEALADEGGEFAATTRDTMLKRSPTSLMLTLRLLRAGRQSSGLVECLEREFSAGVEILRNHDFYEGVRAAIIDKDRNPQWSPASLDEVQAESIDAYLGGKHGSLFPDHRL